MLFGGGVIFYSKNLNKYFYLIFRHSIDQNAFFLILVIFFSLDEELFLFDLILYLYRSAQTWIFVFSTKLYADMREFVLYRSTYGIRNSCFFPFTYPQSFPAVDYYSISQGVSFPITTKAFSVDIDFDIWKALFFFFFLSWQKEIGLQKDDWDRGCLGNLKHLRRCYSRHLSKIVLLCVCSYQTGLIRLSICAFKESV